MFNYSNIKHTIDKINPLLFESDSLLGNSSVTGPQKAYLFIGSMIYEFPCPRAIIEGSARILHHGNDLLVKIATFQRDCRSYEVCTHQPLPNSATKSWRSRIFKLASTFLITVAKEDYYCQ